MPRAQARRRRGLVSSFRAAGPAFDILLPIVLNTSSAGGFFDQISAARVDLLSVAAVDVGQGHCSPVTGLFRPSLCHSTSCRSCSHGRARASRSVLGAARLPARLDDAVKLRSVVVAAAGHRHVTIVDVEVQQRALRTWALFQQHFRGPSRWGLARLTPLRRLLAAFSWLGRWDAGATRITFAGNVNAGAGDVARSTKLLRPGVGGLAGCWVDGLFWTTAGCGGFAWVPPVGF